MRMYSWLLNNDRCARRFYAISVISILVAEKVFSREYDTKLKKHLGSMLRLSRLFTFYIKAVYIIVSVESMCLLVLLGFPHLRLRIHLAHDQASKMLVWVLDIQTQITQFLFNNENSEVQIFFI